MSQEQSPTRGGRFAEGPDPELRSFTASLGFDRRMWREDLEGSRVHARMLGRQGILAESEVTAILGGLDRIADEIEAEVFPWRPEHEDLHLNVEVRLIELIGDPGRRLHTARSRNDQVALDSRLWMRRSVGEVLADLGRLRRACLDRAGVHFADPLPGLTHTQPAQPVTLGHHLLAWEAGLARDAARLRDARARFNQSPLGAGALAGTTFAIDPEWVAGELGFEGVAENSLDAVGDRDWALETLAALAILGVHCSRIAHEMVEWASPSYGFIALPDRIAMGSSMMPQKRNPEAAELARGKAGRLIGYLVALLVTVKALPLAYNSDLQEDKEALFGAVDTARAVVRALATMVESVEFRTQRMAEAAGESFSTATDLADYLVGRGLPFRDAHRLVGRLVARCEESGDSLATLPLSAYREVWPGAEESIREVASVYNSLSARDVPGGTAPRRVQKAVATARKRLEEEFQR